MVCQFRVRTCTDRTRATGARVRLRLFERAVDAGARDLPYACNAPQTITASKGGRECLAHRLGKAAVPPGSAAASPTPNWHGRLNGDQRSLGRGDPKVASKHAKTILVA